MFFNYNKRRISLFIILGVPMPGTDCESSLLSIRAIILSSREDVDCRMLTALRLIRVLERIIEQRRKPVCLRTDNGPEFISHKLQEWCENRGIRIVYIQPGNPTQNAFIERKNGSLRRGLLDAYMFSSLTEVRFMDEERQRDYNMERPHM